MHVDFVCTMVFFFLHVCNKLRLRITADGEEDVYTQPVWHAEWTRQVFKQRNAVLFNRQSDRYVIKCKT